MHQVPTRIVMQEEQDIAVQVTLDTIRVQVTADRDILRLSTSPITLRL